MLTVSQASSPVVELGYVALFEIGWALCRWPLTVSARWLTWTNRGLQGAVGNHHDCRDSWLDAR